MSSPGTSTSMGRVLLVCRDPATIQQVADGMQQLAIATEICADVRSALRLLNRQKFEAVIVDFGLDEADQVLESVRLSQSNRTAVTFAIKDPQKTVALEMQTNFVMEKPLSPNAVSRTLKAAFGSIVRERRRSFRCPIAVPAAILIDGAEVGCRLMNISEGGMALSELPSLKPGTPVKVQFELPGQVVRFKIESEVCWCDEKGRAGLRWLVILSEQRAVLQEWLTAKLEEDLPESVARQFRKE